MMNTINRFGISLFVTVCVGLIAHSASGVEHTKDPLPAIQKRVADEKAVLVDVREKREWDGGHISGAVFLPLSVLQAGVSAEDLAKQLPKERIIYTHCAAGGRCRIAAEVLEKLGYDVRPLKPGYNDLIKAGFRKADE